MSGKVLIVDDEPNIVTSLEFLMRKNRYEVQVARDGGEALGLVERFRPDVVLLDVMMPVWSGLEVCRRIRANPELRGVKIVMLTARGRESERDRGLAAGANAYVTKPFSTKELVSTVRELMPGR
jgi:DNA-binding response OmpR family regulator